MKRSAMRRGSNKKNFSRNSRVHRRNVATRSPMRGGIRL